MNIFHRDTRRQIHLMNMIIWWRKNQRKH